MIRRSILSIRVTPARKIYIFWHEYILYPLYLRGHCNLSMLLSQHLDAEVLSHVGAHMGFDFVRGSSSRGGAAALRELLAKSRKMNLTITPDGPRGPRRRLAQGPRVSRLKAETADRGNGFWLRPALALQ